MLGAQQIRAALAGDFGRQAALELPPPLQAYVEEARRLRPQPWMHADPLACPAGRALTEAAPAEQIATIKAALQAVLDFVTAPAHRSYEDHDALKALLSVLLRRRQPFTAGDLIAILDALAARSRAWGWGVPLPGLLRCLARRLEELDLTEELARSIERLQRAGAIYARTAEHRRALRTLDAAIGRRPLDAEVVQADDAWGRAVRETLHALPEDRRAAWDTLLTHLATAAGTQPSAAWLRAVGEAIASVGEATFAEMAVVWLGLLRPPTTWTGDPRRALTDQHADVLRGLLWCASQRDDEALARAVGAAADACYRKIPYVGAWQPRLGNACVWALGAMPGQHGVAQLLRLRERVRGVVPQRLIAAALERAASRAGLTPDDLAELAAPTFGLTAGSLRRSFDGWTAELTATGARQVDLCWHEEGGRLRRAAPAAVKQAWPAEVKALTTTAADIRQALPAQRDRLERLLLNEREWALAAWRERYLDHPLLSVLARRLIWRFGDEQPGLLGAWRDGQLVDANDQPLTGLTDATRVRLWRPIESDAATVLAWRRWLEGHEITQPFKQAHREVYLLTDAERQTAVYSNRFAAHLLRQHQFQALCRERGWTYRLQSPQFDSANTPTLSLPRLGIVAEFLVNGADDIEDGATAAGMFRYLTTDQVRFCRPGERTPVPLDEIPAAVFSEVMRDVDLFVGVCSVGNDPTWADRGATGYWQAFAFGDLGETARTRRAQLERLLPRLKIAARASLTDRFLVVRGDLHTYKIHLGSGNIMIEPGNRYLCIVAGQSAAADRLYLPFEGDGTLALILSKALLLANDRAITDPTITRQL